jgi:hypothetical protein
MRLIDAYVQRPRVRLFHYTTAAGLLGIAKDRKIWATHVLHMNDASEYRESLSKVQQEVEKSESGETDAVRLLTALDGLLIAEQMRLFVASFSERGNVLSQWRAYSGGGVGYSVGFDPAQLDYLTADENSTFVQCIYREDQQRSLFKAIAESLLDIFRHENTADHGRWMRSHYPEFLKAVRFIAAIKHSGFHEEREWRLIRIRPDWNDISFRPGRFGLTPYIECPLGLEQQPIRIAQLYVGPCAESKVALEAAKLFAESNLRIDGSGTRGPRPKENVMSCDLPYRT